MDLQSAYMRAYLLGITTRINRATTTLDWAHGQQTLAPQELIPPFPSDPGARAAAMQDWERYRKQLQSLGPRILKTKRLGAVGSVNWGGDSDTVDDALAGMDLDALALTAFDDLCANGITAGWAYIHEDTGEARTQILGGYKEPFYREDDPTGDVIGLYQVTADPGQTKVRYRVRVYDFEEEQIREWRDMADPTRLDATPTQTWERTSMPRVVIFDTNHDGYPVGELNTALETLRSEVAVQARIMRVADAQAYGTLALAGAWDDVSEIGGTTVLRSTDPSASAQRIEPANMDALFNLHDRTMERLRGDLSLPIASIGGGSWPSGEALQQANVAYISSSKQYAGMLSRLLTGVVADYADLVGISDPPPVVVGINQEFEKSARMRFVQELYREGLLPLSAAVRDLSVFIPTWSNKDVEKFISEQSARVTPDDLRAALGVGDGE